MKESSKIRASLRVLVPAVIAILSGACASRGSNAPVEGLDPSALPREVQADYGVFAQRCSKCHSIARPLMSGITDENYWSMYVERMRRQPGSGISPADAVEILRFLHYYALQQLREKSHPAAPPASAPTLPSNGEPGAPAAPPGSAPAEGTTESGT